MSAGPAEAHEQFADHFGVNEDAPCADSALLVPLKRSPEFRQIRPGLLGRAPHHPVDSWQEDGFHFFVFALTTNGMNSVAVTNETPVAVFAMHHDVAEPVSGVIVSPRADGTAEVRSLRDPDVTYSAPLPA